MNQPAHPLISIIIPCTDSLVLPAILTALRSQIPGTEQVEILLVGSDRHQMIHPEAPIQFFPTGPEASCASDKRNLGMQIAQGDYFLFLDDDCIPDPGWLRGLLDRLVSGEAVVGGAVRFSRRNYFQMADNLSAFHDLLPYTSPGPRPYLATANLGVCRKVVAQAGLMPPGQNRADDLEWTQRFRENGFSLFFEPRACVFHDPPRRDFCSVWRHWTSDAPQTLRVRLRYMQSLQTPRLAKQRSIFLWGAPLIAAWATGRTYAHWRTWISYAHALPLVYLTKLAWCWSAYAHFPRSTQQESQ